ncbi:hypothetical protein X769_23625 [Mesorhizobium sp. LSJC268A00]|nr:hypothetical protein X769_23625 [Mesorhizobium sp. LSJC268A00]ESY48873.1 hypothetical protein X746_07250 [Mesorhizobium sp. LNJC380A00]ESZ44173.1 hypothetical protein X730_26540 [Mesorhizobium sp. L103C565B0]
MHGCAHDERKPASLERNQQSALRKNWEQAAGPVDGSIMAEQFEPATEITPGSLQ